MKVSAPRSVGFRPLAVFDPSAVFDPKIAAMVK